jgi:hypothetical protein
MARDLFDGFPLNATSPLPALTLFLKYRFRVLTFGYDACKETIFNSQQLLINQLCSHLGGQHVSWRYIIEPGGAFTQFIKAVSSPSNAFKPFS